MHKRHYHILGRDQLNMSSLIMSTKVGPQGLNVQDVYLKCFVWSGKALCFLFLCLARHQRDVIMHIISSLCFASPITWTFSMQNASLIIPTKTCLHGSWTELNLFCFESLRFQCTSNYLHYQVHGHSHNSFLLRFRHN